jgi:hypothetical protein
MSRASTSLRRVLQTWMAGTSPAMTEVLAGACLKSCLFQNDIENRRQAAGGAADDLHDFRPKHDAREPVATSPCPSAETKSCWGPYATPRANVWFESKAALTAPKPNFRFDPETGLKSDIGSGPFRAKSGNRLRCPEPFARPIRRRPNWVSWFCTWPSAAVQSPR